MRMRGHRCSKSFFLREKKLLNAILRVKLKLHETFFFLMNEMFFAMQKADFSRVELFAKKGHFRA